MTRDLFIKHIKFLDRYNKFFEYAEKRLTVMNSHRTVTDIAFNETISKIASVVYKSKYNKCTLNALLYLPYAYAKFTYDEDGHLYGKNEELETLTLLDLLKYYKSLEHYINDILPKLHESIILANLQKEIEKI